jgi:hypothetical protein
VLETGFVEGRAKRGGTNERDRHLVRAYVEDERLQGHCCRLTGVFESDQQEPRPLGFVQFEHRQSRRCGSRRVLRLSLRRTLRRIGPRMCAWSSGPLFPIALDEAVPSLLDGDERSRGHRTRRRVRVGSVAVSFGL